MTKKALLILFSAFAALQLSAQRYTPETVPNVQLRDYRQFVSNPDGILSQAAVDEINVTCLELKEKELAQVAVLVLGSVDPDDLDMFAHTVFNLWKVGQKGKDNGLVISVVKEQRDIQFETGYGLEGVLPDALCKRIQTVYMIPPLRDGNWDKGVLDGVRAVYNVLTDNQEELGALQAAENENKEPLMLLVFVLIFFVPFGLIILAVVLAQRKANTCPVCHTKGGLKLIKRERVAKTRTSETIESTYKCKNCGHIVKRRKTHNTGGGGIMMGGGGMGGFGGGRGFGGGGGFGGGFGGGMSGGGGARSGF